MFSDEGVIHYVTVIRLQDFLKLCDVIVLVGTVMKNKEKIFDKTLLWYTSEMTTGFQNEWRHFDVIISWY